MADDLLRTITTQALIAAFALLLAISSLVRLLFFVYFVGPGGGFMSGPRLDSSAVIETALTVILFLLSVISIYSLLGLRRRYSRLLALAEKLGR